MHRTSKGVSPSFKQPPGNPELKIEIKISTANKAVAAIVSPLRANQVALYGTADLAPSHTNTELGFPFTAPSALSQAKREIAGLLYASSTLQSWSC